MNRKGKREFGFPDQLNLNTESKSAHIFLFSYLQKTQLPRMKSYDSQLFIRGKIVFWRLLTRRIQTLLIFAFKFSWSKNQKSGFPLQILVFLYNIFEIEYFLDSEDVLLWKSLTQFQEFSTDCLFVNWHTIFNIMGWSASIMILFSLSNELLSASFNGARLTHFKAYRVLVVLCCTNRTIP